MKSREELIGEIINAGELDITPGSDPSGAIVVLLDAATEIERLTISPQWRDTIRRDELGEAVVAAIGQARLELADAYSQEFEELDQLSDDEIFAKARGLGVPVEHDERALARADGNYTDDDLAWREEEAAQLMEELPRYAEFVRTRLGAEVTGAERNGAVMARGRMGSVESISYDQEWLKFIDTSDLESATVQAINQLSGYQERFQAEKERLFPAIAASQKS